MMPPNHDENAAIVFLLVKCCNRAFSFLFLSYLSIYITIIKEIEEQEKKKEGEKCKTQMEILNKVYNFRRREGDNRQTSSIIIAFYATVNNASNNNHNNIIIIIFDIKRQ